MRIQGSSGAIKPLGTPPPPPRPINTPLTTSAFWTLAGSYQDLLYAFNTVDSIPLSTLRSSPLRHTPPASETDSMPSLVSASSTTPDESLFEFPNQPAQPISALRTRGGGPKSTLAEPLTYEPSPSSCRVCFKDEACQMSRCRNPQIPH